MSVERKRCSRCKEDRPVTEFFKHAKQGYQAYCTPCKYARLKEWRKSDAGKAYQARRSVHASGANRKEHLQRRYKMTPEEHQAHIDAAGGVCEICGQPPKNILYVDHCHSTGNFRGMLCRPCNLVIGFAQDKTDVLERAIDYLNKRK